MVNDSCHSNTAFWQTDHKGLAMTFLKSLWRKLFKIKPCVYYTSEWRDVGDALAFTRKVEFTNNAYDPSQDPEKLLRGEVESYFD